MRLAETDDRRLTSASYRAAISMSLSPAQSRRFRARRGLQIRRNFDPRRPLIRRGMIEPVRASKICCMAALWNRAAHYIFILSFLLSFFFFLSFFFA